MSVYTDTSRCEWCGELVSPAIANVIELPSVKTRRFYFHPSCWSATVVAERLAGNTTKSPWRSLTAMTYEYSSGRQEEKKTDQDLIEDYLRRKYHLSGMTG